MKQSTVTIEYACLECGQVLEAPDHYALMAMFCTSCGSPNHVPAAPSGEKWREIRNMRGNYEVSDFGRVRRVRSARGTQMGRLLVPAIEKKTGFSVVSLSVGGGNDRQYKVHKLVWEAFNKRVPPQMHVAHENTEPDESGALANHLSNLKLEVGTRRA